MSSAMRSMEVGKRGAERRDDVSRKEAADWYAIISSPDSTAEECAGFREWMSDPVNKREYLATHAMMAQAESAVSGRETRSLVGIAAKKDNGGMASRMAASATVWRPLLAAAVVLIVTVIAVSQFMRPLQSGETYQTALGERQSIHLADGSTIMLNTNSKVRVAYTERERRLYLENGQAIFSVATDASRPFNVYSDEGVVSAIGTEFDIRRRASAMEVTLLEGRVKVTHREARTGVMDWLRSSQDDNTAIILNAGEGVAITAAGLATPFEGVDVARARAWADGKVILRNTPLEKAVVEMNRYSSLKIEIADDTLRELPISGVFKAGQSETFVASLEVLHSVRVRRVHDRLFLSAAPAED